MNGGNAQIGSDHVLRYPLVDARKKLVHQRVALKRRKGVKVFHPGVEVEKVIFGNEPPQLFPFGKILVSPFNGPPGHYHHFGMLKRFQLVSRRLTVQESAVIGDELAFNGEVQGMSRSLAIIYQHPDQALFEEVNFVYYAGLLTKAGLFGKLLPVAEVHKSLGLFFANADELLQGFFKSRAQGSGHSLRREI